MTRTMSAYRLVEWQQAPRVVEVPVPRPGPGEVLIRVAGTGLCHSDVAMMEMPAEIGEMIGWSMPFTLGHEVAGWIDEVGPGVTGFESGTSVAVVSPQSCGVCAFCTTGNDHACEAGLAGRGYGRDGGLAQYMLVDSTRFLIPLGALDPVVAGPLTDAGATSYHAVKRVLPRLVPGSTAVVLGAGGLGAFAIQHLRALSPARVVAVDPNPDRRAYAYDAGADEVIDGVAEATAGELRSLTGGQGAEAVLDFVGTDDTIATGLAATRKLGSFVLVGAGHGTLTGSWWAGLPKGAEVYSFQGSNISDAREVVALAAAGLIRPDIDRYEWDRIDAAYRDLEMGTLRGRAVVVPEP